MNNREKIKDLKRSLSKLSKSIDELKTDDKEEISESLPENNYKGFAQAFRIVSELFANLLVGGLIGWTLDFLLDTKPILLIIFLIIGLISGIYTSYKSAMNWQK